MFPDCDNIFILQCISIMEEEQIMLSQEMKIMVHVQ